jgi:acyl dehydratase
MRDSARARVVTDAEEILGLAGQTLGPSDWLEVTQANVDAFGRSVQDWHWAHNDPERAARGPFGGAIAHAHMTLSIIPHLRERLLTFASGECMFYGYNRVRFPTIVPVGARVRMYGTVIEAVEIDGGEQLTLDLRIEVEGQERPGCLAQAIWRHYDIDPPASAGRTSTQHRAAPGQSTASTLVAPRPSTNPDT